ncbi:hypothetical protein H7J06_27660 [Mycobacterium hodleri]|uniref:hypothetical protein n=1 Tax=Mycolicibacterium hodleri TaxID=49897 RepID=UPI0021F3443E|nr:hypothetical protein [Mycolicibacterium hodleri]MCV7136747.1 hypothetical protein [Mycolicibacterium hodleri]
MNVPFVIATFIGVLLPIFAPRSDIARARRIFRAGVGVAVVSAFFIGFPPDWKSGAQLSAFVAFMMLGTAYFTSPYLKFRGKIHAAYRADAEAEDPPGPTPRGATRLLTSARKLWWFIVAGMALCTFNVVQPVLTGDDPRLAMAMAAVILVIAVVFGFADGRAGDPIAQGQTLQFVLASVLTAGIFALLYLGARAVGKRKRSPG